MSSTDALLDLVILIVVSLVPALIYLSWVRGTERFRTTSLGPIVGAFIYGALFATLVAAVLELVLVDLGTSVSQNIPGPSSRSSTGTRTPARSSSSSSSRRSSRRP